MTARPQTSGKAYEEGLWKTVAAKLAYLLCKRDFPHADEARLEHEAAKILAACVDLERRRS